MPMPLIMYGKTYCDDSDHTRNSLQTLQIPFEEVNIDHDPSANQFVIFINGGYRSTPTLVFSSGKFKVIITEPSDEALKRVLLQTGYALEA
jgi:mycoredoxin